MHDYTNGKLHETGKLVLASLKSINRINKCLRRSRENINKCATASRLESSNDSRSPSARDDASESECSVNSVGRIGRTSKVARMSSQLTNGRFGTAPGSL